MTIRIGIMGYGNLGRGIECAVKYADDMELAAVFTRRDPSTVNILTDGVEVLRAEEALNFKDKIDVMILCGGSATDLEEQTPHYAEHFNVVDSFDTHPKILSHFDEVNEASSRGNKVAVISAGWDPGLFSINRIYANAVLPQGETYTFWGKGLSQGHSDAIRRIPGVLDARQYTIPMEEAMEAVRKGERPQLTTAQKHKRQCFVVAEREEDEEIIRDKIVNMPDYFVDYETKVNFITQEELNTYHTSMAHGGFVIHSGTTGWNMENSNVIEYRLTLDSNPNFTSSVLTAIARAAYRLSLDGVTGCHTMADIPVSYMSTKTNRELLETMF